ncbi:hypothetical protein CHCC20335_2232 [Bacillus paralicheniformis]|nr:hypothetical protein CHCC20335_2232 [Bacillus paralicheniformis]
MKPVIIDDFPVDISRKFFFQLAVNTLSYTSNIQYPVIGNLPATGSTLSTVC